MSSRRGLWNFTALSDSAKRYEKVDDFHSNRALVTVNGKTGFIDAEGRLVIDTIYSVTQWKFENGFCAIGKKNGKEGIVDTMGNVIVPFEYTLIWINKGYAELMDKNGKLSLIDLRNMNSIPINEYESYLYGRPTVKVEGTNRSVANLQPTVKVEGTNRSVANFIDGVALVYIDFETIAVDSLGNRLNIKKKYKLLNNLGRGYLLCRNGKKYGVVDRNGKVVVKPKYKCSKPNLRAYKILDGDIPIAFDKGKELVFFDKEYKESFKKPYNMGIWGIYDDGEYIIYKQLHEGSVLQSYVIDMKGREYLKEVDYKICIGLRCGLFVVEKDKKIGVVDLLGNVVVPFEYEATYEDDVSFSDNILMMKKNGEYRFFRLYRE